VVFVVVFVVVTGGVCRDSKACNQRQAKDSNQQLAHRHGVLLRVPAIALPDSRCRDHIAHHPVCIKNIFART
jgi:hypothetical protein